MNGLSRKNGDDKHIAIKTKEQKIDSFRRSFMVIWILLCTVMIIMLFRFFQLQIQKADYFTEKSEKNYLQNHRIPAVRGTIYDRKRRTLVENRASFNLYMTPAFSKKPLETLMKVDRLVGLSLDDLRMAEDKIKNSKKLERFQPILLIQDLSADKQALFEFHRLEFDGVETIPTPHRLYKYGPFGSHILGYMSEIDPVLLEKSKAEGKSYKQGDYIGKKGVEMAYEDALKGVNGTEMVLVDARGRRADDHDFKGNFLAGIKTPAYPGNNLIMSLDLDLQLAAENAFDGREGGLIALDPQTGAVLAMVSRPSFDPNMLTGRLTKDSWWKLVTDPLKPLMNKVTQDHNHPGSTYKIVGSLAGLGTGSITPSAVQTCPGSFRLGRIVFRCWKDRGHGPVDLHRALAQSCDVYFYKLGDKLGIDNMALYARMLGFGERSGIEIKDETPGVVPDTIFYQKPMFGGYHKGYAINTAIGQGDVNVTLLQLALAYSAIANGGRLMKPYTVQHLESPDGKIIKSFEPETRRKLYIDPDSLAAIQSGLEAVVSEPGGTGYSKRPPELRHIKMGGKTGTAQVVAVGSKRIKAEDMEFMQRDHAWFVVYAPSVNPEILVAVLNKHAGHGATAAAPIAMKVIKAYFETVKGMKFESAKTAGSKVCPYDDFEDTVFLPGILTDEEIKAISPSD